VLTIRNEQLEVFDKAVVGGFEVEMVQHLRAFNPKHCEHLGESSIRQIIRLGIQEAKKYGFTNRGPVRLYLECMFLLGSYFDRDPLYSRISDVLIDCQYSNQMSRAEDLCDKLQKYVAKVFGPSRAFQLLAVQRMAKVSVDDSALRSGNQGEVIVSSLKDFFPQKARFVGDSSLHALSEWGIKAVEPLAASTNTEVVLFTTLGFMLGRAFTADPQFPWISATLKDSTARTPDTRIAEVYKQTHSYLQQTLE
jgi:hypothetical protein